MNTARLRTFFLRNFLLPGVEYCSKSRFWSSYKDSLKFDHWQASHRAALQEKKLSDLFNLALLSSFHQSRLVLHGLKPLPVQPKEARSVLSSLAPVTKVEIRRNFPIGTTIRRDSADWRYFSTSGTNDRLTVVADFTKRDHVRSSELRTLQVTMKEDVAVTSVLIPPNACNVLCGLVEKGPPTFLGYLWYSLRQGTLLTPEAHSDLRGRFERRVLLPQLTLPPIEPAPAKQLLEVVDGHLNQIRKVQPVLLRGFPMYMLWLADRLAQTGRTFPNLEVVGPLGGLTSAQMAARIKAGFGVDYANVYGTSEFGFMAASCGQSPGMHVFEDLFIVEVLRKERRVPPGQIGRLVITDLTNGAMPLIRYDVGDVGRLHTSPCPCGRQTARLEILGRVQETLDTPAGPLAASDIADTFFSSPAIANFRLEETSPASFEAAIVPGWSDAQVDVESWKERFAALHTGVCKLRARIVPFIQPEASGKYRFVRPFAEGGEPL